MRRIAGALLATTVLFTGLAQSASAADLAAPVYRPAVPVVVPYSWTGLYVGVNIGYSWGKETNDFTVLGVGTVSESQTVNGVIGGYQSGYNHQFGAWVFGFESDLQASGQKGSSTYAILAVPATTLVADHKLPWFGTSRTRIGYLATPTILLYGTAGVAYGQIKDDYAFAVAGVGAVTASFKDVRAGWTAGGGIEGAFGAGWSAKLEYLYMDLGTQTQTISAPAFGAVATWNNRATDNIVRVGLNYRWGGRAY
jgi:outer membrane immunogenic protein